MASFDSLGPLSNAGRSIYRAAKNYTKGYSDIQTKVRAATSNDPFGPSGTQMNELAQATFNQQDFIEIMEMLDKRLNDKGKNWRHVFKGLTLLDYLLHAGSENVVLYFQENMYIVKTLREFVHIDDDGKDQGANVRQKAKEITALLMDEARIKEQRRARSDMRDRMSGYPTRASRPDDDDSDDDDNEARRNQRTKREVTSKEDQDLKKALEESKRMAAQEQARSKRNKQDEDDLEKAIRLSKEEDERRRRMLEGNSNLFDPDNPNNGRNGNGSTWDSLIDMTDNQPQQPQPQMPMITGFPTTQFQSFNPYYQQQQEELMRQQQMMEMQRQMQEQEAYNQMMQQQAMLQQQQQQQQMMYQQQFAQQQQPLQPQHTSIGSNNPFAQFAKPASPPPMPTQQPPPLAQRPASTPAQSVQQRPPRDDGKYAHLAGLLGNRDDGVDTFGNQGALRYGQASGRVLAQQTGSTNPFQRQQQQQQQQQSQQRNDLLLDL